MLSGYLLATPSGASKPADLRVYFIRRFFRIAPGLLRVRRAAVPLLRRPPAGVQRAGRGSSCWPNATFTHYLFPGHLDALNVNGALWTLTIEMLLYAFLPIMALLVRFNPWLGTAILVGIGLGWRAWVAWDGDWLREPFFGDNQFNLGIESLFIARQFIGAVSIFALGILARWLVVHGHIDGIYRRLPARLGVSSFLVLMLPSIALLYWVEKGTFFTNPLLFTVYDFVLMLMLVPALLLAARPPQFSPSPLRSVRHLAGRAQLQHLPVALPDHPGHL